VCVGHYLGNFTLWLHIMFTSYQLQNKNKKQNTRINVYLFRYHRCRESCCCSCPIDTMHNSNRDCWFLSKYVNKN